MGSATNQEVTLTEEQEEELERVRSAANAAALKPKNRLNTLKRNLDKERAKAASQRAQLQGLREKLSLFEGEG